MNPKFQKTNSKKNLLENCKSQKIIRLNSSEFSNGPNTNRKSLTRQILAVPSCEEDSIQNRKRKAVVGPTNKRLKSNEKVNVRNELLSADFSSCFSKKRNFTGKIDGQIFDNGNVQGLLKGTFTGELIVQKQRLVDRPEKSNKLTKKSTLPKKSPVEMLKLDVVAKDLRDCKSEDLKNGLNEKCRNRPTTRKLSKRRIGEQDQDKDRDRESLGRDFLRLDLTKVRSVSNARQNSKPKARTVTERPKLISTNSNQFKKTKKKSCFENLSNRNLNLEEIFTKNSQREFCTHEAVKKIKPADLKIGQKKCKIVANKKANANISEQSEIPRKKIKISKNQFREMHSNFGSKNTPSELKDTFKLSALNFNNPLEKPKPALLTKRSSNLQILDFCNREYIGRKYRLKTRRNQLFVVTRLVKKVQKQWRRFLDQRNKTGHHSNQSFEFNELINEHNDSDNKTIIILNNNINSENSRIETGFELKNQRLVSQLLKHDFQSKHSEETVYAPGNSKELKSVQRKPEKNEKSNSKNQGKKTELVSDCRKIVRDDCETQLRELKEKSDQSQFSNLKPKKTQVGVEEKVFEEQGTRKGVNQLTSSEICQNKNMFLKKTEMEINPLENLQESSKINKLVSVFDSLSNEQILKWKSFREYLLNGENDATAAQNPTFQKMLTETEKTLQFLQKNLEIEKLKFAEKNCCFSSPKKNETVNQNSSFSRTELKSKEKWLNLNDDVAKKNEFKLLHDKYFQNSGQSISKSLIFPKNVTEKSFRSECNLSVKDDTVPGDLVSSVIDLRVHSNHKTELEPLDPARTESLAEQLTDFIFDLLLGDLVNSEQISKCVKIPFDESEPLFKRNLQILHNYLNNFSEFVIFNNLPEIKFALNKPGRFPTRQLLSSFYLDDCEFVEVDPVLKLDYYLGFEEREFNESDSSIPGTEITHILHKCFFDALSEALDGLKVFGFEGLCQKRFQTNETQVISADWFDEIGTITAVEKACNLVLNWNDILCGFYGREIRLTGGVDEGYIGLLREERMSKFVFQGISEENHQWTNSCREQFEVQVQLSEIIVDFLLVDAIQFLSA